MTTKPKIGAKTKKTVDKPRKLTKKERDEAFELMNENFSKAMTILLSDLEKQKLGSRSLKSS